jgi:hypothetical protein
LSDEEVTDVVIDVQGIVDEAATTTLVFETPEEEAPAEPVYTSNPTLKQICSCESGNGKYGTPNQFELDGVTPLVGKLTPIRLGQDIGMCQINTKYHLATAESLGYDIYTEEGNWGYAEYLFETQGSQPWSASRGCWGS